MPFLAMKLLDGSIIGFDLGDSIPDISLLRPYVGDDFFAEWERTTERVGPEEDLVGFIAYLMEDFNRIIESVSDNIFVKKQVQIQLIESVLNFLLQVECCVHLQHADNEKNHKNN